MSINTNPADIAAYDATKNGTAWTSRRTGRTLEVVDMNVNHVVNVLNIVRDLEDFRTYHPLSNALIKVAGSGEGFDVLVPEEVDENTVSTLRQLAAITNDEVSTLLSNLAESIENDIADDLDLDEEDGESDDSDDSDDSGLEDAFAELEDAVGELVGKISDKVGDLVSTRPGFGLKDFLRKLGE